MENFSFAFFPARRETSASRLACCVASQGSRARHVGAHKSQPLVQQRLERVHDRRQFVPPGDGRSRQRENCAPACPAPGEPVSFRRCLAFAKATPRAIEARCEAQGSRRSPVPPPAADSGSRPDRMRSRAQRPLPPAPWHSGMRSRRASSSWTPAPSGRPRNGPPARLRCPHSGASGCAGRPDPEPGPRRTPAALCGPSCRRIRSRSGPER